jgi:bifunctional DNase/RNase
LSAPEHISIQVEMICEYALTQRSIVVLGALSGNQYLPIRMLTDEALTVERALKSRLDNPLVTSQDPLLQLMTKLGGRIEKVILRSLVKQNYYASLIVSQGGQHHEVDCRLSDALVLAIRAQIPLQIAPALLEEAGIIIEHMDINPAIAEAELPDPPESVATSDQWPDNFVEQVWSFLLDMLHMHRKPHDLSRLRGLAWDELFPTKEANWDGQTMQVVRLPASESAWLVVRPELWRQLSRFVGWVQHRDISNLAEPQPTFVPLIADQQSQVEELLEQAWPTLIDLGARSLALMHLGGRLVSWKSLDSYDAAIRMGRAAVKDFVLQRSFTALVGAAAEPAIKITYERSTAFNPAQAVGTNIDWTSEALIHNAWLVVIGLASDQQQREAQSQLTRVQESLAVLLPG